MKLRLMTAFAALLLASASAWAYHCPVEMQKIDEALGKNPPLTAQQLAEVKKLRADGEALHKAGKHDESLATLEKAKAILNIK